MFEGSYTFDVAVREDYVSVKLKALKNHDDSRGYVVPIGNIDSVSNDEIPQEWIPATYASVENLAKGMLYKQSGEFPVLRKLLYTEGTFINPETQRVAYLVYKHRDRCVTVVLKEPQTMTVGGRVASAIQKFGIFPAKEFSFEVEDKEVAKALIQQAVNSRSCPPA